MIFFIYGTDTYRCREKLTEVQDGFVLKRDKAGLNVVIMDGEKLNVDSFKQEALATPFLGEKKMIIVKNIFGNKKISKPLVEFLTESEDRIDNIICFYHVFSPEKIRLAPNRKIILADGLFKHLASQKFAWEFNQMNNAELNTWLKDYTDKSHIPIDGSALRELSILVGNDANNLVLELKKLTAYKNGASISPADVKLLTRAKYDENIFTLIDAISQKNAKLALKLISDQINSGNHALLILKMISRQFKIMLRIKDGGTAATAGVHPFVFKKAQAQANNFSLEILKTIYRELIDIERQLKRGHKNPELLLDVFVATHCRN